MPSAPDELPPAYYLPLGDGRFEPTDATTSPWDASAQHGGPPTALLATCLDDAFGRPAMRVARISTDFLGPVLRTALRVETRLVRPGKRVQLSEATMWAGDRAVAMARVWHLATTGEVPGTGGGNGAGDGGGAGGSSQVGVPADLPEPQAQRYFGGDSSWGYGRATEWRMVSGGFGRTTGAGDVWTRLRIPLVAGRPLDGLARFAVIADSANGLSAPKSMRDWWFIPPGVTMHLHRYPVGEWVRLTAASDPGEDGIGLTEGTLADALGRCGTVTQALLVAPRLGRGPSRLGSMTNDRISISVADAIADVRLNRPDKLNALDRDMFSGLSEASAALAKRDDVRVVVLSGNGRAFCAGLDLAAMAGSDPSFGVLDDRAHGIANVFQNAAWGWRSLPVPVIAAIHGVAFGGGLQIALGADIRIVSADAKLAVMEARWGLVPDMAGIALLRGLVRDDVARELTYTARQFSGAEAVALGIATRVADDPHLAAIELAGQIAGRSPRAVRSAKRLFGLSQDDGADALLLAESREQEQLLAGPDLPEAIAAAAEKRPPRFAD